MRDERYNQEPEERKRFAEEEKIISKIDAKGNHWEKSYFGGGAHFQNWLNQIKELTDEENIEIEEVDSQGFKCFEQGGEKLYRIWVKAKDTD